MPLRTLRFFIKLLFTIAIVAGLAYFFRNQLIPLFFQPTATTVQAGKNSISTHAEVVANDLTAPWEMAFLPNGDMLITERRGTLVRIGKIKTRIKIPEVDASGEGGLLGMALDPEFETTSYLYLYKTTRRNGTLQNEIVRYTYNAEGELRNKTIIFNNIPAARFHNGGRLLFGPDGYLYVTTGDAQQRSSAQNTQSLAGKILRITKDGKPAPNNPFSSAIYSYGHRNPQGLAWDEQGRLWATEHGERGNDEVNLILSGHNYGWPVIQGQETAQGMMAPALTSGKNETWAPSGITYLNSSLYFGGLRGQTLYEAKLDENQSGFRQLLGHFRKQYGRIRNVIVGPDHFLYIMTSNKDGRGQPAANDDRIIRINPKSLK
ncbi:PQQ-dependent sugar dehydrogenase [Legionella nagasakiensis]|uniref:PQQ-dependent sugar dehydrogenase n=1 Tax=Legionella nagasakiensis TaxID=535290 RepID=UPI0013EF7D56|nr:PQQ-dependent sugar dehydrogenase [Legionella nagasakiensis]